MLCAVNCFVFALYVAALFEARKEELFSEQCSHTFNGIILSQTLFVLYVHNDVHVNETY